MNKIGPVAGQALAGLILEEWKVSYGDVIVRILDRAR